MFFVDSQHSCAPVTYSANAATPAAAQNVCNVNVLKAFTASSHVPTPHYRSSPSIRHASTRSACFDHKRTKHGNVFHVFDTHTCFLREFETDSCSFPDAMVQTTDANIWIRTFPSTDADFLYSSNTRAFTLDEYIRHFHQKDLPVLFVNDLRTDKSHAD